MSENDQAVADPMLDQIAEDHEQLQQQSLADDQPAEVRSLDDQSDVQAEQKLAGKYNSVEDLEKGYEHANSHLEDIKEDNKNLRQQIQILNNQVATQPANGAVDVADDEKFNEFMNQQFDEDQQKAVRTLVDSAVKPLREQLQKKEQQSDVDRVRSEFPNCEDPTMIAKVQEIVNETPQLSLYKAFCIADRDNVKGKLSKLTEAEKRLRELERLGGYVDGGGSAVTPRRAAPKADAQDAFVNDIFVGNKK